MAAKSKAKSTKFSKSRAKSKKKASKSTLSKVKEAVKRRERLPKQTEYRQAKAQATQKQ